MFGKKREIYRRLKKSDEITASIKGCIIQSTKDHAMTMIVRNISEHKKAEENLRLSEEKFSKAFYNNQAAMAITGVNDGKIIDVNNKYSEISGYKREELIGKCTLDLWVDTKERKKLARIFIDKGYIENFEFTFIRKSGEIGIGLMAVSVIELEGDNYFLSSIIDITERKKTEEDLRFSNEQFIKVFNANPLPMVIVSLEGDEGVRAVNEAFTQRIGCAKENLIGNNLTAYWTNTSERDQFRKIIKQKGYVKNFEFIVNKDGSFRGVVLFSAVTIHWQGEECFLGVVNDITELRRYQEEIARLDCLNLIGKMSAGISHEIRNPMTTVKGFLQLFKENDRYLDDRKIINLMIEELDRANAIITEFLSLSKIKVIKLQSQSLNNTIKKIYPLLQANALKEDKNIELKLSDIPHVFFDKNEIHQLIINLVNNGLEAMTPGGCLTIKTFKENNRVILAIKDKGKGIAPELHERIGTPFFTTKDSGTGLGLAVCYSIAERHKAELDYETSSGGITFYLRFQVENSMLK